MDGKHFNHRWFQKHEHRCGVRGTGGQRPNYTRRAILETVHMANAWFRTHQSADATQSARESDHHASSWLVVCCLICPQPSSHSAKGSERGGFARLGRYDLLIRLCGCHWSSGRDGQQVHKISRCDQSHVQIGEYETALMLSRQA